MKISTICFDLDDTLLDTSHFLIPQAYREAVTGMIENGWLGTQLEADQFRKTYQGPPESLFLELAKSKGQDPKKTSLLQQIGTDKFYRRKIPPTLPLMDGARELLDELKRSFDLFLVTAGDPPTQLSKVHALKIESYFKSCFYVDASVPESKMTAFREIITLQKINPEALLSIGNRIDQEIELAKRLGAQTCWMQHGEHSSGVPKGPMQKPDYKVTRLRDIIKTCQLSLQAS